MAGRAGTLTVGLFLTALGGGGCSTVVPALPDDTQLAVGSVVKGVQCEMREAVLVATQGGRRPWLLDWEAAYALTLNVTETGSVKAIGASPVTAPTLIVGLSAGANATGTRRRIAKLNFVAKLSEIRGYHCLGYREVRDHPFVTERSLGRAGLSEWLNRALDAVDPAGPDDGTTPRALRPASVGHTFEFIVEVDASAGAGFALLPTGGATFGPSGTAGRTDDHSLEVTFAPAKTVVKTVKVPKTVVIPGRAPTPEETRELVRLNAAATDLELQLNQPEMQIQGFDRLSPGEQGRRKAELSAQVQRNREAASRIEDRLKPQTRTIRETRTTVETLPSSAQEALIQLQFERLLSVPRF
ncbi:hypothetical protein [Methylobacterium sp. V23]|uniref:hypothetical protein n=1 Tax=Methylobacterium sp. V23 TaxID=2044878 RepID=UPI0011B00C5C|nr:hypothetical protein [Methylobacterium sp. V23]